MKADRLDQASSYRPGHYESPFLTGSFKMFRIKNKRFMTVAEWRAGINTGINGIATKVTGRFGGESSVRLIVPASPRVVFLGVPLGHSEKVVPAGQSFDEAAERSRIDGINTTYVNVIPKVLQVRRRVIPKP